MTVEIAEPNVVTETVPSTCQLPVRKPTEVLGRIGTLETRLALKNSFKEVDDTLRFSIQAISDVVTLSGMLNTDFNDVRTIMHGQKGIYLGCGAADGGALAVLSRSSNSGSRVRIAPRSPPRLSRRSAARLITCSSSRTLPGQG